MNTTLSVDLLHLYDTRRRVVVVGVLIVELPEIFRATEFFNVVVERETLLYRWSKANAMFHASAKGYNYCTVNATLHHCYQQSSTIVEIYFFFQIVSFSIIITSNTDTPLL